MIWDQSANERWVITQCSTNHLWLHCDRVMAIHDYWGEGKIHDCFETSTYLKIHVCIRHHSQNWIWLVYKWDFCCLSRVRFWQITYETSMISTIWVQFPWLFATNLHALPHLCGSTFALCAQDGFYTSCLGLSSHHPFCCTSCCCNCESLHFLVI